MLWIEPPSNYTLFLRGRARDNKASKTSNTHPKAKEHASGFAQKIWLQVSDQRSGSQQLGGGSNISLSMLYRNVLWQSVRYYDPGMTIEVPTPHKTEYATVQFATEVAYNALVNSLQKQGMELTPCLGLVYLPVPEAAQAFQEACRRIVAALQISDKTV